MQNLTIAQTLTMSSREIAELTEKQHKHVLEDCRKMFEALNIQSADFSADYKDSKGRVYQEFLLDQDLTMTLVMGYSIELRHIKLPSAGVNWKNKPRSQLFRKHTPMYCASLPNLQRKNNIWHWSIRNKKKRFIAYKTSSK